MSKSNDAKKYFEQGHAYFERGKYNKAIENYDRVIKLFPNSANAHYNRGNACINKGDYDEAIKSYNKVIEINPNDIDAHYNRGKAYVSKRDYKKGIEDYRKVLQLSPKDVGAFNNLGNIYSRQGYYGKAIQNFEEAIRLDPKNPILYNNLGSVYSQRGDYGDAINNFEVAVRLNPNLNEIYYILGNYYNKLNAPDKAIEICTKGIDLQFPHAEILYNYRGVAYHNKKLYDEAIKNFTCAIEINNQYADAYNNRGKAHEQNHDHQSAEHDYKKASELGDVRAYEHQGYNYINISERKDTKEGMLYLDKSKDRFIQGGILAKEKGIDDAPFVEGEKEADKKLTMLRIKGFLGPFGMGVLIAVAGGFILWLIKIVVALILSGLSD